MPYKPKFWPTIVRKSDYYKHLSGREFERAESIPCRLGHSFGHLFKPLLPCVDRRILGREVCKIHTYNQFYGNKHNLL